MTIAFLYWLLYILGLLFSGYTYRTALGTPLVWGHSLLLWILLFLIGWRIFGFPIVN